MTKKKMWFATGLYILCALIWMVNFFLHWHKDGMIQFSTALFGISAVLFTAAAAGSIAGLIRVHKQEDK